MMPADIETRSPQVTGAPFREERPESAPAWTLRGATTRPRRRRDPALRRCVVSPRTRHRAFPALAVGLCMLVAVGAAESANDVTLFDNTRTGTPSDVETYSRNGRRDQVQRFRTGSNSHGYAPSSISLQVKRTGTIDESTISVSIRSAPSGSERPETVVASLTKTSGSIGTSYAEHTWSVPAGTVLLPNTSYGIFIEHSAADSSNHLVLGGYSTVLDTFADGWSFLGNMRGYDADSRGYTSRFQLAGAMTGTVLAPPDAVNDLSATLGCTTAKLSWSDVTDATKYRVEWKRNRIGGSAWSEARHRIVTGTTASIGGLTQFRKYDVRVLAGNDADLFAETGNVVNVTLRGCFDAEWADAPAMHEGNGRRFTVNLESSEYVVGSLAEMRGHIVSITGGRIASLKRIRKVRFYSPLHRRIRAATRTWQVTIEPTGTDDVTLEVTGGIECDQDGALCSYLGEMLAETISITIPAAMNAHTAPPDCPKGGWPLTVCVTDATVAEGGQLEFKIVLNRKVKRDATEFVPEPVRRFEVWFDVETLDGDGAVGRALGASTGGDYRRIPKTTLYIAQGESERTVRVETFSDSVSDGGETVKLKVSNARWVNFYNYSGRATFHRLRITRPEGTGTITNSGPMPRAWLARFGRTAAEHVVDGIRGRIEAPRAAGASGSLAGISLGGGANTEGTDAPGAYTGRDGLLSHAPVTEPAGAGPTQGMTGTELLTRSAFSVTGEGAGGGSLAVWGRGARSGFEGTDEAVGLDGDVTSLTLGADWAGGPWLAGIALSQSSGDGTWRGAEDDGEVDASLTGLYPYVGYHATERLTLWGAGGHGTGELTLTTAHERLRTDISMTMAAAGARGELVVRDGDEGPALALEADGLHARTDSDAIPGMAASKADVTRLRLALEGSHGIVGEEGTLLMPKLELGVRHDAGDAETGFGADIGAGLLFASARAGLRAEVSGRTLMAHEDDEFRDWGVSASAQFDPKPDSALGPSVTLRHALGADASGGARALFERTTMAGLADGDGAGSDARLEVEAAYGLALRDAPGVASPYTGLSWTEEGGRAYRIGTRWQLAPDALLALEARRAETREGAPTNAALLRAEVRW